MILTTKHKKILKKAVNLDTRFLTFEGPSQNGKSTLALLAFGLRVIKSKAQLHCMAAQDLDSIRDNLLEGENKFLDLFGDSVRIVGGNMGSKYVEMVTSNGVKKILLAGYSNKKTWTKILGKPIENFLIDEINIADKQFIYESFARQFSFSNPFTVATLNGDDPDHYIYQNYINYCADLNDKDTPVSTLRQMKEFDKKKGYYYSFFRLQDHPAMTDEKLENIYAAYPPNSFYFQTKVLGVRGVQEGMLYANLIENKHYIEWKNIDKNAIKQLEIGVDIGDNAETVFTLTGYTKNYSRAVVIDTIAFNQADYDEIIERFNNWIDDWYRQFGHVIKTIWVDAADSIFIRTLRARISMPVLVRPSKKLTIKERVVLKEQLLHQNRLLFVRDFGGKDTALMLKKIKTDGRGGHLDEGKAEMDYNDALDYSLTPHLKKLSDYSKGVIDGNS